MKAQVRVTLKSGILDPQGKAIEEALASLGFNDVGSVRQGKTFDIELNEPDDEKARIIIADMCEKLLANTVIEDYQVVTDG
ncbi:MAG: phosphoribosylformylglycinamidine synthase subunit PurS [Devosiaceae bacterium]|nr:phosphoribosylformylglycinamidine synthase subunit PurS [Devosiaceae bacterium]